MINTTNTQVCHTYAMPGYYDVYIDGGNFINIILNNQLVNDFWIGSSLATDGKDHTINLSNNNIVTLHTGALQPLTK